MLDGLFGSKFSNKCKHSIKYIRARLDPVRKKKQAVVWYLRRDVAELISHGHDLNAFSRMEALIVEMNQESCYNSIEQYCEDILKQLKVLEKQRECPDEAKEAIATLIFAAARFPDLRELCEIRQIFTEKFGSQIESYVNSEFMKNTREKTFSDEKKIRAMQNIAQEFSIAFDAKTLKSKLANPSQAKLDETKKESYQKSEIRIEPKQLLAEPKKLRSKPKELQPEPREFQYKPRDFQAEMKEIRAESKDIHVIPKKPEKTEPHQLDGMQKKNNYREKSKHDHIKEAPYSFDQDKPGLGSVKALSEKKQVNTRPVIDRSQVKDNESDYLRPEPIEKIRTKMVPPPYTKPNTPRLGKFTEDGIGSDPYVRSVKDEKPTIPVPPYVKPTNTEKPKPISVRSRVPKPQIISEPPNNNNNNNNNNEDALFDEELLARAQDTKKKHKQKYNDDVDNNGEFDFAKEFGKLGRTSSSKSKQRGHDEQDEEDNAIDYGNLLRGPPRGHKSRHREKRDDDDSVMDKMLMHYSRKGLSGADTEPVKERSRTRLPPQPPLTGRAMVNQVHNGPERAVSLPTDPVREEEEMNRVPKRAASLQPDPFSVNGPRVHPNLPDFDELAARMKALRRAS